MKREQRFVSFGSPAAILKELKVINEKMPDFFKNNEFVADLASIVATNAMMRHFGVSYDSLKYNIDNIPFNFPEFTARILNREALILSVNMNGKPVQDGDAEFVFVYFSLTDDKENLYAMAVYSQRYGALSFPEDERELQEMMDYYLVIMPWQEEMHLQLAANQS